MILVGVLAALAADRWNQARLDRAEGADYRNRLIGEFVADSVRLDSEQRTAFEAREAGKALLASLQTGSAAPMGELYEQCIRHAPLPHAGGATFQEILNTGALDLLSPTVRQLLFDYRGYVDATLARLQDARYLNRQPLAGAVNQSDAILLFPAEEFGERLREIPNIAGLVTAGCIINNNGTVGILGAWLDRLAGVLNELRH